MTETHPTTDAGPEAYELVLVDSDDVAHEIGASLALGTDTALTLHDRFLAWAPEGLSADEVVEWGRAEVSSRAGLAPDQVDSVRSVDWRYGDHRYGFREAPRD
jgi:hypothetical protein